MGVQSALASGYALLASPLGITGEFEAENAGAVLVAFGIGLFGIALLAERIGPSRRDTERSTSRENVYAVWVVIALVVFVLVAVATAAMVVPSGTYEYEVVSTESPTDDPQVLEPGGTSEITRSVDNAGYLPVIVVHEPSDGLGAEPGWQSISPRGSGETALLLSAPESTGEYTHHVSEHRYVAVLPPSAIVWLHGIHPSIAITAVNVVLVGAVVGVVAALFGRGDIRIRSVGDHVDFGTRIRRRLRRRR
jgi:signal peptidase I